MDLRRQLAQRHVAMGPPLAVVEEDSSISAGNAAAGSSRSSGHWAPVLEWEQYYDRMKDYTLPGTDNCFRVYFGGEAKAEGGSCVFVLLHGGGHSSLSWALTAQQLKSSARVVAFDFRGHGHSRCKDEADLALGTLGADTIHLTNALLANDETVASVVLVGHSLGGAVAVFAAASERVEKLAGVVVLDVVEGTAMASLATLKSYLAQIPRSFPSIEHAIRWSIKAGMPKNRESARVSLPPRLTEREDGKYVWRTDLSASKPYWKAWYSGMSKSFLSCKVPKLLVLAGRDRLDTELTIAQMQGKFQLTLLPDCGHCIQEDDPERTVRILLDMMERYGL
ncbi:Protein phosphatase methylesterase 1 [Balamuthia mandrillaris]